MWSCNEFRTWLAASGRGGLWEEVVVPGMKRAVIQTLLTVQDSMEARKASFELYGADFLLGCDLNPWLLEMNVSPTMACSTAVTARLCPAVQKDTLRVVLDQRCNQSAHTGDFELIYKQAAVKVPHYVGVNLLVEGAHIKCPHFFRSKTFTRSHYESLFKSRHAITNCQHQSGLGKESRCDVKKKLWPAISSRKKKIERSLTLQPILEKRCSREVLPSSCPFPNPCHRSHTSTSGSISTEESQHRSYRTQRSLLYLKHINPSLDTISLQPEPKLIDNSMHSCPLQISHISHTVMHT